MLKLTIRPTAVRSALTAGVLVVALAGCGGSSGTATPASAPTSAPAGAGGPTGAPGAGGGRRFGADFQAIQACLTAAGISLPTPTRTFSRPTGTFARPTGVRPTGVRPSGGFRDGRGQGGAFGQVFRDPKAQAALKACGITLPTGRPGGPRPGATPGA
jgi:hypothetical protein